MTLETLFLTFFDYLAAPWPIFSHYQGDDFTFSMLITVFYIFEPKFTGNLVKRLDP